jgi:hypothetical protein
MNNFSTIIEDVKKLDYDELQELNFVTGKYIAEIERDKIKQAHKESLEEYKSGNLKFSSDFNDLKNILDNI